MTKNIERSATLALFVWVLSSSAQTSAQMPVPPPMEQSTADCARPVFASDQLICSDAELRDLDAQLAQALQQNGVLSATEFTEDNGQWFKRRSRCAFETEHRTCLLEAYRDRIAIAKGPVTSPAHTTTAKCKSLGRVQLGVLPTRHISIRSVNAKALIAIASPLGQQSSWNPVLTVTERGRNFDFKSQNGRSFSCRATP